MHDFNTEYCTAISSLLIPVTAYWRYLHTNIERDTLLVCLCMCVYVCDCMCMKDSGQPQLLFFRCCPPWIIRQVLSH